ncbi:SdrD B-like domain-containing protein, partial [Pseudactinotalea sp.]|uniref:SdrD B-like domain-containing protein n=1 Tax=Pseudactinotalea sp. TaxID=1926260 RepID=UPI003B3BD596
MRRPPGTLSRGIAALGVVGLVGTGFVAVGAAPAAAAEGDEITGTIWQDYDANGVMDSYETGLPGIEVYAYDAEGNAAGPVVTGADGTYALPVTSDASQWRVEANVPDTAQWAQWRDSVVGRSGDPANGTTVQFVEVIDGTGAAGVDFSFHV